MTTRYIKGTMTFDKMPDQESLELARDLYDGSIANIATGAVQPAADGVHYQVPFVIEVLLNIRELPPWMVELHYEAHKLNHDSEFDTLHFDYLLEEVPAFFCCDVSGAQLDMRNCDDAALRLVGELAVRRAHNEEMTEKRMNERRAANGSREHHDRYSSSPRAMRPACAEAPALDDALAELDSLIGLESVKQQVHDIAAIVQNRGADALPCLHMTFTGNPGTGKTEVARCTGKVLHALGVVKTGAFVETDRSGLVGQYVGQTAQVTKRKIEEAMGGVLFIDEAYALGLYAEGDLGAGAHGGRRVDFGEEAIATLIKEMEDHRNEFACIMAGYPREMERMISVNPGLRDRIGFHISFPDYTAAELAEIFAFMTGKRGYALSEGASEFIGEKLVDVEAAKTSDFSNARLVRKIVERSIFKHDVRCGGELLELVDVEAAFADDDLAALTPQATRMPFGFAPSM